MLNSLQRGKDCEHGIHPFLEDVQVEGTDGLHGGSDSSVLQECLRGFFNHQWLFLLWLLFIRHWLSWFATLRFMFADSLQAEFLILSWDHHPEPAYIGTEVPESDATSASVIPDSFISSFIETFLLALFALVVVMFVQTQWCYDIKHYCSMSTLFWKYGRYYWELVALYGPPMKTLWKVTLKLLKDFSIWWGKTWRRRKLRNG